MEINKLNDQNKYLSEQARENEQQLRLILMSNDKTEFSGENSE